MFLFFINIIYYYFEMPNTLHNSKQYRMLF